MGREVKTTDEENREYRTKLKKLVERLYPEYYTETFVLNYENKALRRIADLVVLASLPMVIFIGVIEFMN